MDADREHQLVAENADLKKRLASVEAKIAMLTQQVEKLTAALDKSRREATVRGCAIVPGQLTQDLLCHLDYQCDRSSRDTQPTE